MRKTLLTLALGALAAVSLSAKDYTDTLAVTVNGSTTKQTATISVDHNTDGTYNFNLKNFMLQVGGQAVGVGNISLTDLQPAASSKGDLVVFNDSIAISAGDNPAVTMWMGPMLGKIGLDLRLLVNDSKLYTLIYIDMKETLGQDIEVTFGDNYQLPNSGFEDYRTERISKLNALFQRENVDVEEPLHWHSFASASGEYAETVNALSDPHTFSSTVTRPGSTGSKSLMLTSTSVFGIPANGTATTGRMQAGDISAASTKNCAYLSLDSTATDSHGDPFYTRIDGTPDSLAVWVKFKQGTPSAEHPYATVSAALTDGSYYQDPQDKTYTNVVATAKNAKIASNGFAWQRLAIPFEYTNYDKVPKALLVTLATNADAGMGSAADTLYVDDMSLIYNTGTPTVTVDGNNVALTDSVVTTDNVTDPTNAVLNLGTGCHGAFGAFYTVSATGTQRTVRLMYATNDLKTLKTYTLNINKANTDGISYTETATNNNGKTFDLTGREAKTTHHGNVYIVNGKKVLK